MTAVETRRSGLSITRLAHWIVLSWGWRRALVAVSAGALSALAMAPFDAWPILLLTFPILVWLVDGAAGGRLGGLPSAAIAPSPTAEDASKTPTDSNAPQKT